MAQAFAKALGIAAVRREGCIESEDTIVTWCVGHLVTMCYPEVYDDALKRWSLSTIPFIPQTFKYEVIGNVRKQFAIVSGILNRPDVEKIYVCTDAGREGEYIYRLVEMLSGVRGKERLRVWIDSQTDEEILRGIREAKDLSAYDHLSDAAFLRAKEDYLMGINFSRAMTLKYANPIKNYLKTDKCVIAVGRVMTCVLGIVVDREREIRHFVKTPYYGVEGTFALPGEELVASVTASWRVTEDSRYAGSPLLYNEKGFRERETAAELIKELLGEWITSVIEKNEKKKETKNAPLLYNLAELQNDCSRYFKISPDQTLQIAQELYEKKLTTYPRTDARVLSSAVAKEIGSNITGLQGYDKVAVFAKAVLQHGTHKTIHKTRYVNDKAVTDHYAIIPTGQGIAAVKGLSTLAQQVYELIARRFLAVFYPPAIYEKVSLTIAVNNSINENTERFYTNLRSLVQTGFLHVLTRPEQPKTGGEEKEAGKEDERIADEILFSAVKKLRKGSRVTLKSLDMKESETTPPKRYNSGTLILTMENAGQFIEDEELRSRIKGAGIGTSATRAEILKKLVTNRYLQLNKKTQIITPTLLGEMIYEAVNCSMKPMLSPSLTASWEKGLASVANGEIGEAEYMEKLDAFIRRRVNAVKAQDHSGVLRARFEAIAPFYREQTSRDRKSRTKQKRSSGNGQQTEGNHAGDRSGTV